MNLVKTLRVPALALGTLFFAADGTSAHADSFGLSIGAGRGLSVYSGPGFYGRPYYGVGSYRGGFGGVPFDLYPSRAYRPSYGYGRGYGRGPAFYAPPPRRYYSGYRGGYGYGRRCR